MWRDYVRCPVHHPVLGECTADCLQARLEFLKAAQALRVYWHNRKRGQRPMPEAKYQLLLSHTRWRT